MLFFTFMVHKEYFEKSDIIHCSQELYRVEPNKLFNLNTSPYLDSPLTENTIDLYFSYRSIAGRRHHNQGNFSKKTFKLGLAYSFKGLSIQSRWGVWQQVSRHSAGTVAMSSHLFVVMERERERETGLVWAFET